MFDNNGRAIGKDNPLDINVNASAVIQPVDVQARYAQTIQTHSATVITPSTTSVQSSWMDCNGFDKVAITLLNDAATSSDSSISWSHDGSTVQGKETVLASASQKERCGVVDIKARYAKVSVTNFDAAPHTISAWVYLKA